MKNLLAILPDLVAKGWKIEAWCIRSDAPQSLCAHTFFPASRVFPALDVLLFPIFTNLYALWRRLLGNRDSRLLVHSTSANYLGADVVSVHFLNPLWVRLQLRLGFHSFREGCAFLVACYGAILDWLMLLWPKRRLYLPVSESLCLEVQDRQRQSCSTMTIPSVYDPARFSPRIRADVRNASRVELGYSPDDVVLAFASQGSHRRKGLFLGLEALQIARRSNSNIKLLIIGGSAKVTTRLKRQLDSLIPAWPGWIQVAGHVPNLGRALSAADALFFPSYFESFASVELEAAALGLPLLVTDHFGVEMTLRPGINGELLSFDPVEMAAQIVSAVKRLPGYDSSGWNRGITVAEFGERILSAYETALVNKDSR
jgi:glycosyltransferase involved in cell wall biosynthesis